jgi:hypothetical protein
MTPVQAIRKRCIDCKPDGLKEVRNCQDDECYLYPYRMGKRGASKLTPVKSIRHYCLWCMNDQFKEVRMCSSNDCLLFPFRMGKNPNRKG